MNDDDLLASAHDVLRRCELLLQSPDEPLTPDQAADVEAIAAGARLFIERVTACASKISSLRNGQVSYNISHELRGPINPMLGYPRLLLTGYNGSLTDTQRAHLQSIYETSSRLLDDVNALFANARTNSHS